MDQTDMMLVLGFLFIISGSARSKECNYDEFAVCMRDVNSMQGGDFNIINEDQMKEVCNSKMETMQCTSDFIRNCMKPGERDMYEATTGGRLKVVQEMCTEGTKINKGFLENMNCFGNLQDEINFCTEKFKESQTLLNKANMLERLKVFYGCCAFEWYRNCLAKTARMKCNDEASAFMYYVTTKLGGKIQKALCEKSYAKCHGLHGIDQEEIDKRLENTSENDQEETDEKLENIPENEEENIPNSSTHLACAASQIIVLLFMFMSFTIMYREEYML